MPLIKKIGFFSAFVFILIFLGGYLLGGWWNYSTVLFAFVLLPILDYWVGKDPANIPKSKMKIVSSELYYRFITYMWVYAQLGIIFFGAIAVSSGKINTISEWIGFVLSTSLITGGIGITVAHELGHRNTKLEQFYSKILLMTVCYMHFFVEHNRGHHVYVATPIDPATSRKNESFYSFWVRSVFGGYKSAWEIVNTNRLRNEKKVVSLENEMVWYSIIPLLFCTLLTIIVSIAINSFVWQVPVFFFAQSFFAFTLLELVNYVEHYGIVRKKDKEGKYERVTHLHSWNSNFLISNFFLFQLQRHSDHHMIASRRYQVLQHHDDSPQLPYGYSTMILIALFPKFWFSYMNPKLESWKMGIQ